MSPKRIQRKRTTGWRMPPNTVYVGRPTKWGNPALVVGDNHWKTTPHWEVFAGDIGPSLGVFTDVDEARGLAVRYFRDFIALDTPEIPLEYRGIHQRLMRAIRDDLGALRGRDVCCWCPEGSPCHGDVLLELANGDAS